MGKKSILIRRKGRKSISNFMCRRGAHKWTDIGGFDSGVTYFSLRWCTTCGSLEEIDVNNDDIIKIKIPDSGI